jgi:hypothetical protein
MRPNGVPNVTGISNRRVCLGLTRRRHRNYEWRLRVEPRHIYGFDNMMD